MIDMERMASNKEVVVAVVTATSFPKCLEEAWAVAVAAKAQRRERAFNTPSR